MLTEPVCRLGRTDVNYPLRVSHGLAILFDAMGRSFRLSRRRLLGSRYLGAAFLLSWFLAGHPLALYADTLDDFEGPAGPDELTRKTRADLAVPFPDPGWADDDDSRRLHAPRAIVGQLEGVAALAEALQLRSFVTLKRLSRARRPASLRPLQIAPPSCPDGEPPHAG